MNRSTQGPRIAFIEVPNDPRTTQALAAAGSINIHTFRAPDLAVLTSIDAGLWHLSISARGRYPTWDEIAEARYQLVPDNLTMAMLLPPRAEYVNLHATTFHLHELREGGRW